MVLPLNPPVQPMLANTITELPTQPNMIFEPKWDGFRCLIFRDGADVFAQSRSGKDLIRYFPEMIAPLQAELPERVVIDGELVVQVDGRLNFDALTERIHPAASRIALLSTHTPARFIAFDILANGDELLLDQPFRHRRDQLQKLLIGAGNRVHLTPATEDLAVAQNWFTLFEGAGLDGLIAKPALDIYSPGKRTLFKLKHTRTAECVVAGLRWHVNTEPGTAVGSLLLGLYDDNNILHHVGVIGSFPMATRRHLAAELMPYTSGSETEHPWSAEHAVDGQRLPGALNRWRSAEHEWVPLRPERVVEVSYSQTEGVHPVRLRHNGQFLRWRPDRQAHSCRYDQLDQPPRYDMDAVLNGIVRPAS